MKSLWLGLVILRLLWAILPQSGYIHPDEFFQTVEVVAGDSLSINVERTWEFNSSFPLRSVAIPQLVFSPVFKILTFLKDATGVVLSAYHVIASYRLIMAVLSISIDKSIRKVCRLIHLPCDTAALLVASSYVMLTFQTHSFSNSFETLALAALIVLIVEFKESDGRDEATLQCLTVASLCDEKEQEDDDLCDLDSSFNNLHKMAFELRKRNIIGNNLETSSKEPVISDADQSRNKNICDKQINDNTKQRSDYSKSSGLYMHGALIAITVMVGTFNRPTFILIAFLPCLWWLHGFYNDFLMLLKRGFVFLFALIATAFILILFDTVYYNNISLESIFQYETWEIILKHYVMTPLNFILYNSVSSNLASHGYHPFYVHFAVNMPMLYGPFLFCLAKSVTYKYILSQPKSAEVEVSKKSKQTSSVYSHHNVGINFLSFIFFPVLCLSLFPHQEARFLIPFLPLMVLSVVALCEKLSKLLWITLIVFNLTLSLVFGVLHQGGVVPCMFHLQNLHHSETNENITMHIVFSHTYMPPKHLLMSRSADLMLHDMQGKDLKEVYSKLLDIKSLEIQHSSDNLNSRFKIFLALPGTMISELETFSGDSIMYRGEAEFFPHLSFEDPPAFDEVDSLASLYNMLSLILIEVS